MSSDRETSLSPDATMHLRALAARGSDGAPPAVIAAACDRSTSEALRHLEHLERLGLATLSRGGRYLAATAPAQTSARTDAEARRIAQWYLASAVEAARHLACTLAPAPSAPEADRARPAAHFAGPRDALRWAAAERDELIRQVKAFADGGEHRETWRLAHAVLGAALEAPRSVNWWQAAHLGQIAAVALLDEAGEAAILERGAACALRAGQLERAFEAHGRALRLREELGDKPALARSHDGLGLLALRTDDLPQAEARFGQALDLADAGAAPAIAAHAKLNLAALYTRTGRPASARGMLAEAAVYLRANKGENACLAHAETERARTHRDDGDLDQALNIALSAVAAATAAARPSVLAAALVELGMIQRRLGITVNARASLEEARCIFAAIGDILGESHAAAALARTGARTRRGR